MPAFPVVQSLLSPSALLEVVAAEYDVGRLLDCRLWIAGHADVYLVTTDRDRYVLRVYRTGWRTDDEIAYEIDALRHLTKKGVSVAVPVVRKDGAWFRTVEAPEGARQLALFTFARGRAAPGEAGFSEHFGRGLAALHAATDDFRSSHARFRLDLAILLDRPLSRLAPLLAHRSEDWRYLVELAERLRRGVEAFTGARLDWGFCHGDAFGGNAHLDGEVLTHFDFDDCGPGWRAYDLATYRWICAWRAGDAADARWQEFLSGYRERRPLAESELAAVPLFVAVREIWVAGQNAGVAPIRGHWPVNFDNRLRFLRQWEQEHLSTPSA
jgi:Ser/Thr protein kinase RdoA (MazF antagonist)